jgi:alanine-alpha-ketoisovalerate/valine-pyruvate aminotransferase
MKAMEEIKNRLIDRILVSNNEKLLKAIESIFLSVQDKEVLSLSSEQIEMLILSEADIRYGNVISEEELDNLDSR